jgi:drug/metabolite transporter (DMT)-like permease
MFHARRKDEKHNQEPAVKFIPLILFTVLTNALAQILLKKGMLGMGHLDLKAAGFVGAAVQVIFNPYVFTGLCVFVISMASHLVVLSRVELSFAYPFLSLAYVVVLAYAFFIFGENVGVMRTAGVALICAGTVLIAQS